MFFHIAEGEVKVVDFSIQRSCGFEVLGEGNKPGDILLVLVVFNEAEEFDLDALMLQFFGPIQVDNDLAGDIFPIVESGELDSFARLFTDCSLLPACLFVNDNINNRLGN